MFRVKKMELGYLVMRNVGPDQMTLSWDDARVEEERFFASGLWRTIPEDRKGRVAVKKFLGDELYKHVCRELPRLKVEVDATLERLRNDLAAMGTPIASPQVACARLSKATSRLQRQVDHFLDADYDLEYLRAFKNTPIESSGEDPRFIRSSLGNLYHEYQDAMANECNHVTKSEINRLVMRYKGNDLPGMASFTIFKNIVKGHYLDGWKAITHKHLEKSSKHLADAINDFIIHKADVIARDVFTHAFDRFRRQQVKKIEATIDNIFDDESSPFTLSRHYHDNMLKRRPKSNKIPVLPHDPTFLDAYDAKENKDEDEERIVDKVVMETIERYMINKIGEFFETLCEVSELELAPMMESVMLQKRRAELENEIEAFQGVLDELYKAV
ncbi:hypothetical protein BGZ83_004598 [Gryganskiella cystojenkinii]|nr:hypothetical protein BGZ83_004598 [Gryganskiella cystojenkinii]